MQHHSQPAFCAAFARSAAFSTLFASSTSHLAAASGDLRSFAFRLLRDCCLRRALIVHWRSSVALIEATTVIAKPSIYCTRPAAKLAVLVVA